MIEDLKKYNKILTSCSPETEFVREMKNRGHDEQSRKEEL